MGVYSYPNYVYSYPNYVYSYPNYVYSYPNYVYQNVFGIVLFGRYTLVLCLNSRFYSKSVDVDKIPLTEIPLLFANLSFSFCFSSAKKLHVFVSSNAPITMDVCGIFEDQKSRGRERERYFDE